MTTEKKPWQTGEKIRLSTIHPILKEPRDYTFMELNQEYGSRIFWKYVLVIVRQWPKVKESLSGIIKKIKNVKDGDSSALENISDIVDTIVDILPGLFGWDAIAEMSELLLSDHSVVIDDDTLTADSKGFSGASGDPVELFVALFFSMCVNWPKYFSPLLGTALNDLTRDSGPEQKQSEAGEE